MFMSTDIGEYAAYRREVLLRDASTDRLVRRATKLRRPGRTALAAALRAVASCLARAGRPAGEQPVAAVS
jgi:hypothetical protein